MSRRKPELQTIDVNAWPTVAYTELDEGSRLKFEARREAVLRYIAGDSIKAIGNRLAAIAGNRTVGLNAPSRLIMAVALSGFQPSFTTHA